MMSSNDWTPWQELLDAQLGRHRLPQWAWVIVVVALYALLVVTAVRVSAQQSTETWRGLAQCESGQRWNLNTGNGFYGGLQFAAGTWNAYRAPDMPERADLADVFQQVWVAERVHDAEGWGAWPYCSRQMGLR